jgi:phospholipid/cholesterol/gamma-HCH transport system substrate-binding protein
MRRATWTGVTAALLASAVFLFVSARVGGPSLWPARDYHVSVNVPDAHGLVVGSRVLVRGVEVGEVERVDVASRGAELVLSLEEPAAPVRADASVRIGSKTLLEEAFVDLGPGRSTASLPSGARLPARAYRPTVELDEALAPLAGAGGRSQRSILRSLERGLRTERSEEHLSATLGALAPLVARVRTLGDTLDGQENLLRAGTSDARSVLAELAARDYGVRTTVAGARTTLAATSARRAGLAASVHELPRTLEAARRTLRSSRPLLREARPLLTDLRHAAPDVTRALRDTPAVADEAAVVLARLPELERVGVPSLGRAEGVVRGSRPIARSLQPFVANLVPVTGYLAARRAGLSAFVAHTDDLTGARPGRGAAARTFTIDERGTAAGRAGDFRNNAYTQPGDAAHPRPYQPGSYPRLRPLFTP